MFDSGCLDATLVRCVFAGNRRNWALAFTRHGIVAVDCVFGPQSDPGPHIERAHIGDGPWHYPSFMAKRHIVVRVTEAAGDPVCGALVTVEEASGDISAVSHGAAFTDETGRTPGPTQRGAILLADYGYRATDMPDEPVRYHFRYRVRVTAEGYVARVVENADPDQSWTELPVVLVQE